MVSSRIWSRLAALAALLLLWLGPHGQTIAFAKDVSAKDVVQWVGLNASPEGPLGPSGAIHFQAQVSYQLRSEASGFVALFVFENDATTSSLHSPHVQTVSSGAGKVNLDLTYEPNAGVQKLTLLAGLFKADESLLGWTATNAVSLGEWEAKVAFVTAVHDQQAGNYAYAVADLTTAIQEAPQIGNFYYWRGDNESRLGQYDAAVADYTQALKLLPGDRASLLGRGIALLWQGQNDAAINDLTGVIGGAAKADQLTAWALRARGTARANLGLAAPAVDDYQAYLALSPNAADQGEVQGWIGQLAGQTSG